MTCGAIILAALAAIGVAKLYEPAAPYAFWLVLIAILGSALYNAFFGPSCRWCRSRMPARAPVCASCGRDQAATAESPPSQPGS